MRMKMMKKRPHPCPRPLKVNNFALPMVKIIDSKSSKNMQFVNANHTVWVAINKFCQQQKKNNSATI